MDVTCSSCEYQVQKPKLSVELMRFSIPGAIVAEIAAAAPEHALDGSASVTIEALTVAED